MLVLGHDEIRALAPMPRLIEALRTAFRTECTVPARQAINVPGGQGGRLLLAMSAFDAHGGGAVKLVTLFPENPANWLPSIQAAIVVFSATGTPVALLDGTLVTQLRTAAASALASSYLSRPDSEHLVVIGTGALAPYMALAHCTARPIRRVSLWGRRPERVAVAAATLRSLLNREVELSVTESLSATVGTADIVSCATSSATPVLQGKWLKSGTFVDLVGSFSPEKREADDDVVRQARIFVDTFEGALSEAGDLLDPLKRGVIKRERIQGELADLVSGTVRGRVNDDQITVFKSVGTALEDLAAAQLIVAAAAAARGD